MLKGIATLLLESEDSLFSLLLVYLSLKLCQRLLTSLFILILSAPLSLASILVSVAPIYDSFISATIFVVACKGDRGYYLWMNSLLITRTPFFFLLFLYLFFLSEVSRRLRPRRVVLASRSNLLFLALLLLEAFFNGDLPLGESKWVRFLCELFYKGAKLPWFRGDGLSVLKGYIIP